MYIRLLEGDIARGPIHRKSRITAVVSSIKNVYVGGVVVDARAVRHAKVVGRGFAGAGETLSHGKIVSNWLGVSDGKEEGVRSCYLGSR